MVGGLLRAPLFQLAERGALLGRAATGALATVSGRSSDASGAGRTKAEWFSDLRPRTMTAYAGSNSNHKSVPEASKTKVSGSWTARSKESRTSVSGFPSPFSPSFVSFRLTNVLFSPRLSVSRVRAPGPSLSPRRACCRRASTRACANRMRPRARGTWNSVTTWERRSAAVPSTTPNRGSKRGVNRSF